MTGESLACSEKVTLGPEMKFGVLWKLVSGAVASMVKVREVYKQKLDDTRAQIERLRTLEREILASLDYLDTCESACEPDKLLAACPSCNHHDREQEVPDLVAGFRS